MKVHDPKLVSRWLMFTVSGKPVYNLYPRGVTLDKGDNRMQAQTMESTLTEWNMKRLIKAREALGETCEWRYAGQTEVMEVSL